MAGMELEVSPIEPIGYSLLPVFGSHVVVVWL